jgi:hypothetical protein
MEEVLNAHAIKGRSDRTGAADCGGRPVMTSRIPMGLLAVLVSATAGAQDVTVTSTTLAQVWSQDTPGFSKADYTLGTQFLSIDANKLDGGGASLHLYGWGRTDMADQSAAEGKSFGNLTYGYLQYDFERANAQIRAGRFTVNQGVGNEQVDGVSARTDLRGGFSVSAFAGVPVIFKSLLYPQQDAVAFQRNAMFGARLAYSLNRMGEIGLSFLEDGTTAAKDLPIPSPVDYTRRQVGLDLKLMPVSFLDFSGRTVFDVAKHPDAAPGEDRSNIAEHDYRATGKILDTLSVTGTFVQRNFYAYFAGSTMPSLFNQNEKGKFSANGLSATWAPLTGLQLVGDVRTTKRETYGDTTRAGLEARYNWTDQHVLAGAGYHKVNAFSTKLVDAVNPAYSLSHSEMRAWVMAERGAFTASLDAIRLHYSGATLNPYLYGKAIESEIVGSLGYQASATAKLSADVSLEDTPLYKKQVMGLLRAEFRFGFAGKGGK